MKRLSKIDNKMPQMSTTFYLLVSCILSSAVAHQFVPLAQTNQMSRFVALDVPYVKPNSLSKSDLDSLLKMYVLHQLDKKDSPDSGRRETPLASFESQAFESDKRKLDDVGHLRFGRNEKNNKLRIKYTDPDYGHMRFGR